MKVRGFIRALAALEARLGDIVLAGGWAWYLYRKYLTGDQALPGEFTLDLDLVVPRSLSPAGAGLDKLLREADFEEEMEGEARPPVTRHCWPSAREPEAIVEFLTPARGSGDAATLEVDGIVAQQLRFLDLLLDNPLEIAVDENSDDESLNALVRVPRVGLFAWQKALSFKKRTRPEKRHKDLFYLFDLVDGTRSLQPTIESDISGYVERKGQSWIAEAANNVTLECATPESDAIGKVLEQIPEEQRPPRRYISDTFTEFVRILTRAAASGTGR